MKVCFPNLGAIYYSNACGVLVLVCIVFWCASTPYRCAGTPVCYAHPIFYSVTISWLYNGSSALPNQATLMDVSNTSIVLTFDPVSVN